MDFVKFLNDNSLRKKEIAEYLEVVPSVVSDICRGRIGLSPKNREKLEANDKGWDLSALGEPAKPLPYVHAKASGSGHNVATVSLGGERDRIVSLEAENALLRTQVASLEAQLAKRLVLLLLPPPAKPGGQGGAPALHGEMGPWQGRQVSSQRGLSD